MPKYRFLIRVECGAPKIVPSIVPFRQGATGVADREAIGQRMHHAGDAKALPGIIVHQHAAIWLTRGHGADAEYRHETIIGHLHARSRYPGCRASIRNG
ncbi:hypothetical protein ACWAT4_23830 [Bradyrhizobium manausense]